MHNVLTALDADDPWDCAFTRCGEDGREYQCQQPATIVWEHGECVPRAVCAECHEWIGILQSLDQL